MRSAKLLLVFGFGFGFAHHDESFFLQFFYFLSAEVSALRRGVGTAAVFLLFGFCFGFLLLVFGFVLLFPWLLFVISSFFVDSRLVLPIGIFAGLSLLRRLSSLFNSWSRCFLNNGNGWRFSGNCRLFNNYGLLDCSHGFNFLFRFNDCSGLSYCGWQRYDNGGRSILLFGDNLFNHFPLFWSRLSLRFFLFFQDITDYLLVIDVNDLCFGVPVFVGVVEQAFLEGFVVGELFKSGRQCGYGFIEAGVSLVALFEYSPEVGQFLLFFHFAALVVDGQCACECLQVFELVVAVVGQVVRVGLFVEGQGLFGFGAFFQHGCFPVYFLDLFWFEVVFGFEVGYFREFFVDVAYSFVENFEEGFALFFEEFGFVLLGVLGLRLGCFFVHNLNNQQIVTIMATSALQIYKREHTINIFTIHKGFRFQSFRLLLACLLHLSFIEYNSQLCRASPGSAGCLRRWSEWSTAADETSTKSSTGSRGSSRLSIRPLRCTAPRLCSGLANLRSVSSPEMRIRLWSTVLSEMATPRR